MVKFFRSPNNKIYAVGLSEALNSEAIQRLIWLFGKAQPLDEKQVKGPFVGPRKEMVTPWSTNAVEIAQNMAIRGIERIEEFVAKQRSNHFDPMLQATYEELNQDIFTIHITPEPVREIEDIAAYNKEEGLALSQDEIAYLQSVSEELGRKLTDSEVFGFSQVNSEHCRHKIFNGTFIIDGKEMKGSLFALIKKTSQSNPNLIVSAYKDNVAFIKGPKATQFAPATQDKPDYFELKDINTVISLKAETHNFPTTVEPFNGAATGSGGEIRDRLAGGKGSLPLAGTAVYMTSYPRLEKNRSWEQSTKARPWLYQTPLDILIKASDGASDFGNKFGQPLICGSLLTFEHQEGDKYYGFDKVVMLAGGIGFGKYRDSQKEAPGVGDKILLLGGDNYRIGMGGGAVSSVATGQYGNAIELNAVQRSNPEMQKRVMNAIRAMEELDKNPIISIHDHGAGGHLNCFSELVEDTGGTIDINRLPIGDPTLSDKEIVGNESQERMGLVMRDQDLESLKKVAERERAPLYVVGETTGNKTFKVENPKTGKNPIDWHLSHMFGSSPKTVLRDDSEKNKFRSLQYDSNEFERYLESVLQLEAVACKDWLTNKVDRSVTGKVAKQQTCGPIQLPLNNVAVMALDHQGSTGVATALGHAPVAALIDPAAGSKLAVAECLTNLVWAPLTNGLAGVSLSANWMWPAKEKGENYRLYQAVAGLSDFVCQLGINVPTGKDSLSMTQKYPSGKTVYSPGTVIVSAVAEVNDLNSIISPSLEVKTGTTLYYIDFSSDAFQLGGSAFSQVINLVGEHCANVDNAGYFRKAFQAVQRLINDRLVLAGHDISSGGLITTLLEMCFPNEEGGLDVDLAALNESNVVKALFNENPGVVIQVEDIQAVESALTKLNIDFKKIATVTKERSLKIVQGSLSYVLDIDHYRDIWYKSSYLLDKQQSGEQHALNRYHNYKKQPLSYRFPQGFSGKFRQFDLDPARKTGFGVKAAIIREKGVNGDREMAYTMHLAGFDVKDVHMTDLVSGREDLSDVNFIVFVGGFSNSDVLGSAKGWAGAFLYNSKAKKALDDFYSRSDTLSLGVCNGCQLMMELGLVYPTIRDHPTMAHNASGKFESAFVNVDIPENNSVMLSSMAGSRLGVWLAHGEGKFVLPEGEDRYNIVAQYSYDQYPGQPNGSDYAVAALSSTDGRHLAIMPHLERSIFTWNWPHYPSERNEDEVSPWIEAFANVRNWLKDKN